MITRNKVMFFSGAGLSAESGLPTYRDSTGIWAEHKMDIVCNFDTFKENRKEVFKFYNDRVSELEDKKPNRAHLEIASLQQAFGPDRVIVVTQNIDNLLEKAGCIEVHHLHGDLGSYLCTSCRNTWARHASKFDIKEKCPKCADNKGVKPSVVFFNEEAPKYRVLEAYNYLLTPESSMILAIGTAFEVVGAKAVLPFTFYKNSHAININPFSSHALFGRNIEKTATEGLELLKNEIDAFLSQS